MFSIFRFLVLFAAIYTSFRFVSLWKCTKLPMVIYWVIQIALLANYYTIGFGRNSLYTNEALFTTMSVVAGIYFMIFLYAGYISLVMDLLTKVIRKKKEGNVLRFLRNPAKRLFTILCFTFFLGVAGVISMRCKHIVDYNIIIDKETEQTQLKIAAIADAHMGTGVTRKGITRIVELMKPVQILCFWLEIFLTTVRRNP